MVWRNFEFKESGSGKFWNIELNGQEHTVHYGKVGTKGQSQVKAFDSEEAAKKSFETLVAEKLKKGYVELSSEGAVPQVPTPQKKSTSKKKAAVAEVSAEADPQSVPTWVNLEVVRRIDLELADWLRAPWRPRVVQERPAPQPFNLDDCLKRAEKTFKHKYRYSDWNLAKIPNVMTSQEAHFWWRAMTHPAPDGKTILAALKKADFTGQISVKEILTDMQKVDFLPMQAMAVWVNLLPQAEWVKLLAEHQPRGKYHRDYITAEMVGLLIELALPYMHDADLESLRQAVRKSFNPLHWPADIYESPHNSFMLAALLGMHDELLPLIKRWTPSQYAAHGRDGDPSYHHHPQLVVFGLRDPNLVESEFRRMHLSLVKPEVMRGWLAHTEFKGLDYARDNILRVSNKEQSAALVEVFALVKAPEAAAPMLELKLLAKSPQAAKRWLDTELGCAVAGLIPVTLVRGKLGEAAIEQLRDIKRKGHLDLIQRLMKDASTEAQDKVQRTVVDFAEKIYIPLTNADTPDWWTEAAGCEPKLEAGKVAAWVADSPLPPLVIDERRLNDQQMELVLTAMQKTSLDAPHPLLAALRKHSDASSMDAVAWKLFELWQAEGYPSKEKWAMCAIGYLGGDASALKITPLVRNWPGESQHARAVLGLQCLRAIGSDTALMQLNGIAAKLKFKALKQKAAEFMEAIAKDRGLTRQELEDRIVPDCDLDERGSRIFDFGSRQFRFVLGPEMKPMVRDPDGKIKIDLPKPGTKDDADKANDAVAAWKLLKKQIREVVKLQADRLEQVMVTGRRWTVSEFETLLVRHPLMTNLARLLLWGGYDQQGNLSTTFRITEEQDYADSQDEPFALNQAISSVGLVHPLHLSDEQKAAWGEVFSDYELIPPFAQLGRPVYTLEPDELKGTEITRFGNVKIPAATLCFGLDKQGWNRGGLGDHGDFHEHAKYFHREQITAYVQYDPGMGMGWIVDAGNQQITKCFFESGPYVHRYSYSNAKLKSLPLSKIDPVVISEVLNDLTNVASKGT